MAPEFSLIALTPPALLAPSIAIAASRAGALGMLDLEFAGDERAAREAMARLAQDARQPCGVKLAGTAAPLVTAVLARLPDAVHTVLLTPTDPELLRRYVDVVHSRSRRVLLEVTSLAEARLGEETGVDGLIAKGHEAGGRVGDATALVLLQQLLAQTRLPTWCQGGIDPHTAGACYAAGAAGVVLDTQLALTRESPLPQAARAALERMDGSETLCLGASLGVPYRAYYRPGLAVTRELLAREAELASEPGDPDQICRIWCQEIRARAGWGGPDELWLMGQDGAFAGALARRFRTVGGVLQGIREAVDTSVRVARRLRPLDEGSPLSVSHGTRYPIVQGPMTRVSDTAAFADRVAGEGGLPFLALALMRAAEVRALLEETSRVLGDRPWGVGILGFVEPELREEQLAVIRGYRPTFALIAGGRPDQALAMERDGVPTYLHVPSPELLRLFLDNGARRFVFEGRECGGHVGPRSSFVLWSTMIDVLLDAVSPEELAECHVVFAGGIHDATTSMIVSVMAAPLAERGAKVGVLLGTAYLFAEEAVTTGAVTAGFQREALRCEGTVLLETGLGHATRCADTPYVATFDRERRRLTAEGITRDDLREALEGLNLGRLRAASKGIVHNPEHDRDASVPRFVTLSEQEQRDQGMYMMGQVAALRDTTCTIAQLHEAVSVEGSRRLGALPEPGLSCRPATRPMRASEIAIVGMGCILPKAPNLATYWQNILSKVDAITEVPPDRWDWRRWFDPDPAAQDKIYSKWGGFIDDWPFDPLRYGIPPSSLPSIEPLQLLTIEAVHAALEDAGYLDVPFPRQRTSVILGVGGGAGDLGQQYALRSGLPGLLESAPSEVWNRLPEWTEDSFPGILLNVAAGRVANRFDLGGVNYTVDAACASSLAAVYLAVNELEAGTSDVVIVGGADTVQNPFAFLCFSKTRALSPGGRCRTFDEAADGIAISEGVGVLVLKRLEDAERAGDRIYAVIQGVAGSSDGRDKGLTAPRPEGQAVALERAYAKAGFSPATVGLIEAHGTGTVMGDTAEIATLKMAFEAAGAARQGCAIGSVKSMIGHTKCTAGVAGLIKGALALHHKVLPPTMHVDRPNPEVDESPFHVNTELRPWLHSDSTTPRRAGVSAFGFGGTNFHAVLEEYPGSTLGVDDPAPTPDWPSELLVWSARSPAELLTSVRGLLSALEQGASPRLRDLAFTLWEAADDTPLRLALVVSSLEDLREKLGVVCQALAAAAPTELSLSAGICYTTTALAREGLIAFLFPGQGAQSPGMLRDLAVRFTEVRERFEVAERVLGNRLGSLVFPPPSFSPEQRVSQQRALTSTDVAQPAIGAADMSLVRLLESLEVRPDMVAGHSYGEYVALCAAGSLTEPALYQLSEARGRCIARASSQDLGTMVAVSAGLDEVEQALSSLEDVWIANVNGPRQIVVSGTRAGIGRAVELLRGRGIGSCALDVACAFHSPLVAPARDQLADVLADVEFGTPRIPIFSNTSAAPYPEDPHEVIALLTDHMAQRVRFAEQVEAMHRAGARVFVEVGPRNVLTGLVDQILGNRPHVAVSCDAPARPGLFQLQLALGQLYAHGAQLNLDRLHRGRGARTLNLSALVEETAEQPPSPSTWLVNGGRARPLNTPPAPAIPVSTVPVSTVPVPTVPVPAIPVPRAPVDQPPATVDRSGQFSAAGSFPVPVAEPAGSANGSPSPDRADEVVLQFQTLMNRFLETQQEVMGAYLRAGANDSPTPQPVPPPLAYHNGWRAPPESPAESVQGPALAHLPLDERGPADAAPADGQRGGTEPESADTAPVIPDAEELTARLRAVFSERTGYPPEVLNLDLNIESDLGCDSIKRVEILGTFLREYLPADLQGVQAVMEALTGVKTLRGIVETVRTHLSPDTAGPSAPVHSGTAVPDGTPVDESAGTEDTDASRWLLTLIDAPTVEGSPQLAGRAFIVTDDERGAAQLLAAELRSEGAHVCVVRMGHQVTEVGPDSYTADLADLASVTEVVGLVRARCGPIAGLVHLLPLREWSDLEDGDVTAWLDCVNVEVTSLFNLAKVTGQDLRQVCGTDRAWVVAATAMGGGFGIDGTGAAALPATHGGVAGLVKTLVHEWPQVCHKVVDVAPAAVPQDVARRLLAELACDDGEVEVGYLGPRRVIPRLRRAPLGQQEQPQVDLDANSVILVTGGARGITAEVARELATRYRPTLVLVGRSPLPPSEEATDTAGVTSERELKRALIERARSLGEPIEPARIEAAYTSVLHAREIRENVAAMRAAGATVDYRALDVRDHRALGCLVEELYRVHGRVDGVIHGAGVIEDKLIDEKTTESFTRVLETKLIGALALGRSLRPGPLQFLVLFSSVAGRFGNRGQSDYAAANELLNKLALRLDRRWPGRVTSINWGPWKRKGMASAAVQRQFQERNVALIPPRVGVRMLVDELRFGAKGDVEVVIGDGPWAIASGTEQAVPDALPLLGHVLLERGPGGVVELAYELDLQTHPYLEDHRLDGKPVLPAAMALELMAEVVQRCWPQWRVAGVRDLRVFKGIVIDRGRKPIRILASAPRTSRSPAEIEIEVAITDPTSSGPRYYGATVELANQLPQPDGVPLPRAVASTGSLSADEAYHRFLFHGPRFQCISDIERMDETGVVATLLPSSPADCLVDRPQGSWLIDPIVVDSAPQLAIIWSRLNRDMTSLPAGLGRYRRFGPLADGPIRCHLQLRAASTDSMLADVYFTTLGGRLLGLMERLELTMSPALNRLAGAGR